MSQIGATVTDRILQFLAPYIAVLAGAVADWGFVHLHFLGNFHTRDEVAGAVTQLTVWGLTSLLAWLGQRRLITQLQGDTR